VPCLRAFAKILLLAAVGLFYSLVVLNNTTDFNSNYQFVRHVLMMDTTFPGNNGMWARNELAVLASHVLFLDYWVGDCDHGL